MILEQHYLDCLSQASYFIADEQTGRAIVVDPRRDVSPYLNSAAEHGAQIELIVETHFHADFLSGHLELAQRTGATIAYGSVAETEFESRKLADGERISLGDVTLEVRHTPGHTPESICIVVSESPDAPPHAVLTGDTMFIGDVGRPDLLASAGVTAEDLAEQLYDSLHEQLLTLPDETLVYPAHGAGSSCGKNLSSETVSTIGAQRTTNYAAAPMPKADFVELMTTGHSAPPAYFAYDAQLNRELRPLLDEGSPPAPLTMPEVLAQQDAGAVVLDARSPEAFSERHVTGAINVGLTGRFAEFAGGVLDPESDVVLVTNPGDELEAKNRLGRIGFDRVIGALSNIDDMNHDPARMQSAARIDVTELASSLATDGEVQLVDVRQPGETSLGMIDGASAMPLTRLRTELGSLDPSKRTLVYCAGGFRSSIAASVLRANGIDDVVDVLGGYAAWTAASRT